PQQTFTKLGFFGLGFLRAQPRTVSVSLGGLLLLNGGGFGSFGGSAGGIGGRAVLDGLGAGPFGLQARLVSRPAVGFGLGPPLLVQSRLRFGLARLSLRLGLTRLRLGLAGLCVGLALRRGSAFIGQLFFA